MQGLPYGFLTTHHETFFVKHVKGKQYAITDGMLSTMTNPSIPEMLYCECHTS